MDEQMNKKQVLEATIGVLSNICVPVAKQREISEPINGAIRNLAIVLQMIEAEEKAASEQAEKAEEPKENKEGEEDGRENYFE